jgi:hypothetical protein
MGDIMIDKWEYYRLGKYSVPVPPVPTTQWSAQDWINYIDTHGRWHV